MAYKANTVNQINTLFYSQIHSGRHLLHVVSSNDNLYPSCRRFIYIFEKRQMLQNNVCISKIIFAGCFIFVLYFGGVGLGWVFLWGGFGVGFFGNVQFEVGHE